MAQDVISKITKTIEDTYFGEAYFKHLAVIDDVLKSRELVDFRRLKLKMTSPEIESIFKTANFKPADNTKVVMTEARALQIFDQVKAAKAAVTFI